MPAWRLADTHPTQGRTFQRPLDALELGFLWDSLFNGTADNIQRFELRLLQGSRDAHLFSVTNIVRAWISTKRRYPLVGATVRLGGSSDPFCFGEATHSKAEGGGDNNTEFTSKPHFVVREHDLSVLRPHEVVFGRVTGTEEVQRWAAEILNGPRPLSEELLVQLYVFRETNTEGTDILHLMTLMAHYVTDGVANNTFIRCFLDTLARGGDSGSGLAQIPLENRLAMVVPSMDLEPVHLRSLSAAKRRWRRAIGVVIFQLRMEKRQGGHTLPCRLTLSTPHNAARSCRVSTSFTNEQSTVVIANCRLHGITFGNAYLPLAQVAMTRVLYRRYLRGEISEEEWAYRRRQPYLSGGPLNLRPYLDKEWFEKGGGGEFMLSISLFFYQLPFMTLGPAARHPHDPECVLSDGAPPFSDLLTFNRFLHRAGLVKKQAVAFFNHPLFFEIVHATSLLRIERTRHNALRWKRHVETDNGDGITHQNPSTNEVLSVMDMPVVLAHGGSSVGAVDFVSPSEYPLPPTHPLSPYSFVSHPIKAGYVTSPSSSSSTASEVDSIPTIAVEHAETLLHTRPSELYLGAASSRGQLVMYIFYDGNVFEEGVVREWLDEVKGAVLWYLGQTHQSRRAPQSCGGGGNGPESVQARL